MMYSLPKAMLIPLFLTTVAVADGLPVAPNGIPLVQGYRDWQLIAPSSRPDKEQVRAILGNDAAVRALRGGKRPFPDGTILVKIAWSAKKHPSFPDALVPDGVHDQGRREISGNRWLGFCPLRRRWSRAVRENSRFRPRVFRLSHSGGRQ